MADQFDESDQVTFNTDEELANFLKQFRDDIESVILPLSPSYVMYVKDQGPRECRDLGIVVQRTNGARVLVHVDQAERLLNSGILHRLGLKLLLDQQNE